MDEQSQLSLQQEIKNAEEVIEKLKTFTNELEKPLNDNILTHLCDGLETFLGFDSATKGYDGTGIVYSDLDRLCDGVMGFLSGVLEAVKDDDAVKTYYKDMETTLQTIKNNMHKTGGLSKAVDAVSKALGEWDTKVTEKTDEVKALLGNLSNVNLINYNAALSALNSLEGDSLDQVPEKLQKCFDVATQLHKDFRLAETYYARLDSVLTQKLRHNLSNMEVQIETFVAGASNTALKVVVTTAQNYLTTLKEDVNSKVDRAVHKMQDRIYEEFERYFRRPITQVQMDLNATKNDLKQWITAARELLGGAYDKAQSVHSDLDENGTNPNQLIGQNITKLNKAHGKVGPGQQMPEDSIEQVLEKNLSLAIRDAETLVDEKLAVINNSASLFKGIDDEAGSIRQQAWSVYTALTAKTSEIVRRLNKVSDAIAESAAGVHVVLGDDEFSTTKIEELTKLERGNIQDVLESLNKHMSSNYCGHNKYKDAFNDHIAKLKSQIAGLQNISRKPAGDSANIRHRILSNIKQTKQTLQQAMEDFRQQLPTLEKQLTESKSNYLKVIGTANNAMKKLNDISKYVGEANSEIVEMLKAAQNEISEGVVEMWKRSVNDIGNGDQPIFEGAEGLMSEVHGHVERFKTEVVTGIGENNDSKKSSLRGAIEKVRENLHVLATSIRNELKNQTKTKLGLIQSNIQSFVEQITAQLKKLRGILNTDVIGKINEMKTKGLGDGYWEQPKNLKGLGRIRMDLDHILNNNKLGNLRDMLKNANAFTTVILELHANNAIRDIQEYVTIHAAETTKALHLKAKEEYNTKMLTMYQQVRPRVNANIRVMQNIINNDLKSGVKGFLKTLQCGSTKVTANKNVKLLTTLASSMSSSPAHNPPHLKHLAEAFYDFCQPLHTYLQTEITRSNANTPGTARNYSTRLQNIISAFDTLLPHLREQNKYDHRVPSMLSDLRDAVTLLKPDGFSTPNSATLDCITGGLTKFADELDKAYISSYDGHTDLIDFSQLIVTKPALVPKEPKPVADNPQPPEQVLTAEGEKLCKVFFTLLEIFLYDFTYLKEECSERWKTEKLCQNDGGRENPLGIYLQRCGFGVPSKDGVQDAELRYHADLTGGEIRKKFIVGDGAEHVFRNQGIGPLEIIFEECLTHYYSVCHYSTLFSKKHPSSINQMLTWFSGLPHSPVYDDLSLNGFGGLFKKPEHDEEDSEDGGITIKEEDDDAFSAYPETITATKLRGTLTAVCTHAHSTLTAILGHGHAGGTYAVDFNTNAAGLAYPANPSQCLDLLVELALRLYHQLCFLHVQCSRKDYAVSWRDCYYGRYVAGSDWRCNDKQCINQMGNQIADQKTNQTCGQTCDQHPKCGLKSPLQSFLEDGLAGFLPHPYSKSNCKLSCDMANHRGLPCKTPMGFGEISVKASHTRKGEHIAEALADFCGKQNSPLVQLCAQLTCLLQRVPQTLDDLFSFYYNLLNGWNNHRINKRMLHRESALEAAVTGAYFGEAYPELDITPMFKSGEQLKENHSNGNVLCIVNCNNTSPTATCGRYLLPLSVNTWSVYSEKNADKYLSWIVYLTETFYQWLQQLYNECCNNCNKPGSRCYGKVCSKTCPVKSAYASENVAAKLINQKHTRDCKSIARCPSTRPTLCRYGFVFNSSSNLSGAKFDETKRTCNDLCQALQKVLSDKEADEAPLAVLIYKTIPQFLWDIRSKFFWLNVALWLLSLLYLLHIMVIRLDLLHIKSHLHSPSSHRIAAQSLLAAARVNKLNRVFYLQP